MEPAAAPAKPTRRAPNRGVRGGRRDADRLTIRLLPEERARIEAEAREAGLSLASHARAKVLGNPGPRARRMPSVNAELLARAIAQLNKAGSNLNQIAHAMNTARLVGSAGMAGLNHQTLSDVRQAVAEIRTAVGRDSHGKGERSSTTSDGLDAEEVDADQPQFPAALRQAS
jgi:hypothetical protein